MSDIFEASIMKFNFWICTSSINGFYYLGVKVDPTFLTIFSSPPKQTSFNLSAALVLIFTLSFKDPYWSNISVFSSFKQVVKYFLEVG